MIIIAVVVLVAGVLVLIAQSRRRTASVERIERQLHEQQHGPTVAIGDVPEDIVWLARRGDRAGAIKAYRAKTGCDLRSAMEKIDALPPVVKQ